MNSTLSKVLIFAAGVAIGVAATHKYFKTKYQRIADDEIADMSNYYEKKISRLESDLDDAQNEIDDISAEVEARDMVEQYERIANGYVPPAKEVAVIMRKPEVISPEEFGEIDEFDTETLFYYADGVLTDSDNNPIEDVDNIVGRESLTHFGEYEDDSVFVRNHEQQIDYEILLDPGKFADAINPSPHQAEEE